MLTIVRQRATSWQRSSGGRTDGRTDTAVPSPTGGRADVASKRAHYLGLVGRSVDEFDSCRNQSCDTTEARTQLARTPDLPKLAINGARLAQPTAGHYISHTQATTASTDRPTVVEAAAAAIHRRRMSRNSLDCD